MLDPSSRTRFPFARFRNRHIQRQCPRQCQSHQSHPSRRRNNAGCRIWSPSWRIHRHCLSPRQSRNMGISRVKMRLNISYCIVILHGTSVRDWRYNLWNELMRFRVKLQLGNSGRILVLLGRSMRIRFIRQVMVNPGFDWRTFFSGCFIVGVFRLNIFIISRD
jgi:hypothetical protein